ncbi:YihY/virulence factor BrkB family protein [Nocardioides terrisoli]|uniref:YihY/virulence factor BrkB family protein n=1 Tax=Nocardioides terrisoli TaxID=3388267 RepID=UPI00287BB99D|nr:YhjD/YihY/BrkB family envelope integrity protein [Nocardioides marmorisolisilvae]
MSISERLDRTQQRHPVLGFPIACFYKFFDDFGNYLAATMTYYAFVSMVPLLLLASTLLSVILVGHPGLQRQLLNSALAQFPVVGSQLKTPSALAGSPLGVIAGGLVAVYGGLGAAQALQYAGNTIWHVPRNSRPNPFLARGRSLMLLATAGLGMLVATIGSVVLRSMFQQTLLLKVATNIGGAAIAMAVLLVAYQLAPKRHLTLAQLWVGALLAAVLLQLLQTFGFLYVERVIKHATDTNAVFAIFLGLVGYLYLAAVILVLGMEVDVVRAERLWPRALLTPFTDNVVLTRADQTAYAGQAKAQRAKGFQEIDVRFEPGGGNDGDSGDDQ